MSQKVASVLLAFLMLLSSSGVTYAQHFCGDHEMMAKFTLGEAHLSCGMAMELPVQHLQSEVPTVRARLSRTVLLEQKRRIGQS